MGAAVGCGSPLQGECLEGFDFLGLHHIKTHYCNRFALLSVNVLVCFYMVKRSTGCKRSPGGQVIVDTKGVRFPDADAI